jgi:hypothetical protein
LGGRSASTRGSVSQWRSLFGVLGECSLVALPLRFQQLRDCFEKLQNNDFVGQLEEACDQQQEEKRVAKKHELQREVRRTKAKATRRPMMKNNQLKS